MQDVNVFEQIFYSTEVWGYIGPVALVVFGYIVSKKDKALGGLYFATVCMLVSLAYFNKFMTTPAYIWHALIVLFGGLFTCIYPAIKG